MPVTAKPCTISTWLRVRYCQHKVNICVIGFLSIRSGLLHKQSLKRQRIGSIVLLSSSFSYKHNVIGTNDTPWSDSRTNKTSVQRRGTTCRQWPAITDHSADTQRLASTIATVCKGTVEEEKSQREVSPWRSGAEKHHRLVMCGREIQYKNINRLYPVVH